MLWMPRASGASELLLAVLRLAALAISSAPDSPREPCSKASRTSVTGSASKAWSSGGGGTWCSRVMNARSAPCVLRLGGGAAQPQAGQGFQARGPSRGHRMLPRRPASQAARRRYPRRPAAARSQDHVRQSGAPRPKVQRRATRRGVCIVNLKALSGWFWFVSHRDRSYSPPASGARTRVASAACSAISSGARLYTAPAAVERVSSRCRASAATSRR
jgi:hypothetical protein